MKAKSTDLKQIPCERRGPLEADHVTRLGIALEALVHAGPAATLARVPTALLEQRARIAPTAQRVTVESVRVHLDVETPHLGAPMSPTRITASPSSANTCVILPTMGA